MVWFLFNKYFEPYARESLCLNDCHESSHIWKMMNLFFQQLSFNVYENIAECVGNDILFSVYTYIIWRWRHSDDDEVNVHVLVGFSEAIQNNGDLHENEISALEMSVVVVSFAAGISPLHREDEISTDERHYGITQKPLNSFLQKAKATHSFLIRISLHSPASVVFPWEIWRALSLLLSISFFNLFYWR